MEWYKIFDNEQQAHDVLQLKSPRRVQIGDRKICLALSANSFYAVQDACTHNRESLSKGWVNAMGEIVCPWHHYRFDLASGKPCDSSCAELTTYPIRIDNAGFFIGIP